MRCVDQFNVGLRVLCGFGWAALDDCFQAVLRELDVHPGTGCHAVLKGMQKTLAHALLGKILKTSGLLRTLHLEVTAPPPLAASSLHVTRALVASRRRTST